MTDNPSDDITVEQMLALQREKIRNDPAYAAKLDSVAVARNARVEKSRAAQAPLLKDLKDVGISVTSVWSLGSKGESYTQALPVLVSHLQHGDYEDRTLEGIGRALAVKEAVAFWDELKAVYLSPRSSGDREGAAIALAFCARRRHYPDLVSFVEDARGGSLRVHFLRLLIRYGGEDGKALVESYVEDEVLGREASTLIRAKSKRGR